MNPTSCSPTSTTFLLLFTSIIIFSLPSSAETYNNWTNTHFTAPEIAAGIASPLRDHDGDLCPNIVEYFSNTLPKDGTSATTKTFSTEEIPGKVTVRFPAALDRTDVEHVVLVSNDLVNWLEDAVFICHEGDLMYRFTTEDRDAANTWVVVSQRDETETKFTWGWILTKSVVDPLGQALTTTWDYYDSSEFSGPNGDVSGRGRLQSLTLPTGLIRSYTYCDTDPLDAAFTPVTEAYAGTPELGRHACIQNMPRPS